MGGTECEHRDLEYLGEQKSEEGSNKYYLCKSCKGVIIIAPNMRGAYFVKRAGS
ncbi:MAG: hypothetical protein NZ920_03150 [Aigarchaeota archaeon]|nr:hypothetical protein [Aigarchaeota archaeon]MDW8092382.1 hypothetical protein [Nitrososphaerota archaeon]